MTQETGEATPTIEKNGQTIIVRMPIKLLEDEPLKAVSRMIDDAAAADARITLVVLDLSQVSFIPSMGLGLLVQMASKCKSRQQMFKLAAAQPNLRQVFSITRLDRIFQFADSVESAMK